MTEAVAGPSGPGTVVMDVGGDIGALILYTPADMDGREIEISRDDAPAAKRTHSQVRARHMPGGTRYAAVYPGLRSGSYTLWADAERPAVCVVVAGGEVASCSWPSAPA